MSSVLSSRMLERMGELNMTNEQLATLSGIHPNSVYRYATGRSQPTAEKLAAIALSLGVSADWLLGLSESKWRVAIEPERLLKRSR